MKFQLSIIMEISNNKKKQKSYIASKIAEIILDKLLIDDRNFN